MFGLPCSTTCDEFKPHKNLKPGYNQDIIDHAVELYNGGPEGQLLMPVTRLEH